MLFNYTATDAHLVFNSVIYEWDGPPDQVNGALQWSDDFDAIGGNPAQSIEVDVNCPLPGPS
jgi:hypothetical protein